MNERTLHPFRVMLTYETRRTWRSPWPGALVAAAGAMYWAAPLLVGSLPGRLGGWAAPPALVHHREMVFLIPLLGTLVSVYSAWEIQRDRRTGTEEVILAWPLAAWQWVLARSLALGTVTLAVWLTLAAPALVYAVASYAGGAAAGGGLPWLGRALWDAGLIATDLLASLLGAQTLGQVVGAILPGTRGLVVLLLYRMFAVVGPGVVMGTLQWPFVLLMTPDLAVWYPHPWSPYSEAFGLRPHEALFATHRAFWILGGPAALLALAFVLHRRREALAVRAPLVASLAVCLVLASALPFVFHERSRVRAHQAVLAAYGAPVKPQLDEGSDGQGDDAQRKPGAPSITPIRYDIEADLRSAPAAALRATVEVVPQVPLDELRFTLRRAFRVVAVQVDDQPVPPANFHQEGDVLVIRLTAPVRAGQPLQVAMTYEGRIEDWRLAPYEQPVALAGRGVLMIPGTWGWYPVPGEHALTSEVALTSLVYRALIDRVRPFHDATPTFDVTIHAPPGVRALAGFTAETASPGGGTIWRLQARRNQVSLLGGDWWHVRRGHISYLIPMEYLDTWQAAAADLQRLLTAVMEWTGPDSLTVTPHAIPDPYILGTSYFGPVYEASPSREQLADGLRSWLLNMAQATWAAARQGDEFAQRAQSLYFDVVDFVVRRSMEEAFGQAGVREERRRLPGELQVAKWAARTVVPEQKRQLRALFAAARLRPLTAADFAFLGGGEPVAR